MSRRVTRQRGPGSSELALTGHHHAIATGDPHKPAGYARKGAANVFTVGPQTFQGATAGTSVIETKVTGDTGARFRVFADGKHEWGPGDGTFNVALYWSAADTLRLDDMLLVRAPGGTFIQAERDGGSLQMTVRTWGVSGSTGAPAIVGQAARGTEASPTPPQMSDVLFTFGGAGHDGTAFTGNRAVLQFRAEETFSSTTHGMSAVIQTTTLGTASRPDRFKVDARGHVGVGTFTKLSMFTVKPNAAFTGIGTVSTSGTATVTGVGTRFTIEVGIGDRITIGGVTKTVTAIASDTSLTADTAWGTNSGVTYTVTGSVFRAETAGGLFGLLVSDQGDVAIGSAVPASRFDVVRAEASAYHQRWHRSDTGAIWGVSLVSGNWQLGRVGGSGNIVFGVNISGTAAGNVGIGTTTAPSTTLQVAGTISPFADNAHDLGTDALRFRDLKLAGTAKLDGPIDHNGSTIGFFGVTPAARASAYSATNVTTDRSYDADATTVDEVADVLGTLIADLRTYGLVQ